jgi:hypothetical protein
MLDDDVDLVRRARLALKELATLPPTKYAPPTASTGSCRSLLKLEGGGP